MQSAVHQEGLPCSVTAQGCLSYTFTLCTTRKESAPYPIAHAHLSVYFLSITDASSPPSLPSFTRCSPHFSLDQRMEYLSRAVMCAKSTTMTTSFSHDGELLHQLEEKMEVRSRVRGQGSKVAGTATFLLIRWLMVTACVCVCTYVLYTCT